MKKIFTLIFLMCFVALTAVKAQTALDWNVTNGTVNTIVQSGNTVYLGGSFTYAGPNVPYGVALSSTTGLPNTAYAKPDGQVSAVVPDGSGGWYIGGTFT